MDGKILRGKWLKSYVNIGSKRENIRKFKYFSLLFSCCFFVFSHCFGGGNVSAFLYICSFIQHSIVHFILTKILSEFHHIFLHYRYKKND